ncbi:MAG: Na/Pi cotransporter family protein [Saprospiraceae bacterium]|nr:Na/Pi cotransporter family protein [Saprospiraceae bacterium]
MNILQIAGSVGIFIYGMKLMSESVQRAAGDQFRTTLGHITSNKWVAFLIGFAITGLVQSSSATTVMTVSFVNAGLISALESVGLILGANVGTTITGWIVSLLGFKISLSEYAVPIFALGVPMIFLSFGKLRYWGEFLIGVGLLFLGLGFLKSSVPLFSEDTLLFEWLRSWTDGGIFSRLFFVLVGVIISTIVQSSSVAMTLTLTMCAQGWLPIEIAASLILGENIGTTSTALIASLIANREAQITARIHFWFNVIGVFWMVVLLPWFLPLLSSFLTFLFGTEDIYKDALDMTIGLSAFHTAFNFINALLLINVNGWLARIASIGVLQDDGITFSKKNSYQKFLESKDFMPEIASIQIRKEIQDFGKIISVMSELFVEIVNSTDTKRNAKLIKKIGQYEEVTDHIELEVTKHITHLSKQELTEKTSLLFRNALNLSNEFERIADIYYQMSMVLQKKMDDNIYFLPDQREHINDMTSLLGQAFDNIYDQLASEKIFSAFQYEKANKAIKKKSKEMRIEHLKRLGDTDYNIKSAMIYNQIVQYLESIGEHIINITDCLKEQ